MKTSEQKRLKAKKISKKSKELFLEAYTVAPAPSRDYYGLKLYQNKFLWLRWKISRGPYLTPIQNVVDLNDFLKDSTMQNEITHIFGSDVTQLVNEAALKNWKPSSVTTNVLDRILKYLNVDDVVRLSQVCKRLHKECSRNEIWERLYKNRFKMLTQSDIQKASIIGWKCLYLERIKPKSIKPKQNTIISIQNKNSFRHSARPMPTMTSIPKNPPKINRNQLISLSKSKLIIKPDEDKKKLMKSTSEIFQKHHKVKLFGADRPATERPKTGAKGKNEANLNPKHVKSIQRILDPNYEGHVKNELTSSSTSCLLTE